MLKQRWVKNQSFPGHLLVEICKTWNISTVHHHQLLKTRVYPQVWWCDFNFQHSPIIDSQFALSLFLVEGRRFLSLTFKVYLSVDQKESKGLFCVRVAASFTQWQEWKAFLFTHTRSLTYSSFYRSHTLCSRLQSSVSYWPSVSLPIQLSVRARVCRSVREWQIQMEMGL